MKRIFICVIMLFTFCVVNVNAESLKLNLVGEEKKSIKFDVVVTDVTKKGNVFEGTIKYDIETIKNITIDSNDVSWEVHFKKDVDNVKFIAFSMDKVAEENTALFNFKADLRDNISDKEVKVLLSDIGAANGSDSLKVSDVQFNYVVSKDELVEEVPSINDFPSHKVEDVLVEEDVEEQKESKNDKSNKVLVILGVVLVLIVAIVLGFVLFKKGFFLKK